MKKSIEFAVWVFENMYCLTYEDRNKDGKVWTNYLDDGYDGDISQKTYTIKEIYNDFINNKNRV